jgi:lysophospholipase L1-like esterase
VKKIITVNKREVTSIDGTVTMNIKDRELGYYTWDKKLTLRFKGRNPAIAGIKLESANQPLQIFLCGNSTVVDQMGEGWASWGQMIPRFFKAGISVANYAESGLTSGDFLRMKRLDKIMADLKEGDYVFVEFGHNDQKKQAYVESYKSSLKNFYKTISANKAHPIFVTPTARLAEADALTSIGGLAQTMREIAQELQIPCIDLNKMTIILKNALGSDKTSVYKDASHFTPYGGLELAYCVANALKEMNNGISPFILDEVVPYSPLKPHPIDFLTKEKPVVSVANNQEFKLILQRERPCTMINRYLLAKGSNFYNTLGQTIKGWSARQN